MTPKERAVMQQALEALESYSKSDYIKKQHPKRRANGEKAITAVREALVEQAEQSGGPVGVIGWAANIPNTMEEVHWEDECPPIGTTLYAAPVRTKDLTDDEIYEVVIKAIESGASGRYSTVRAVIAAYREKNK